jgi:RimJ/RimL family protein N-acetyltransferase
VIIAPNTSQQIEQHRAQREMIANFMRNLAGVDPSEQTIYLGWLQEDQQGGATLGAAVAFSGFMGNSCQIHVALAPGYNYSPREMLEASFEYAFTHLKRERLIGIVNSLNEKAMVYDQHLGFVEIGRIEGAHDNGGDIVIFSMTKEQCRYLREKEQGNGKKVRRGKTAAAH